AATLPDANSNFWNPAKFAFINDSTNPQRLGDMGFSLSYFDGFYEFWDKDILSQFSFYKSFNKQTLSSSFRLNKWGEITFTDAAGTIIGTGKPFDFCFDLAYSRKFSKSFSGAIAARYIYSDFDFKDHVPSYQVGTSIAIDIAFFYIKKLKSKNLDNSILNFGLNISNIGSKISYSKEYDDKDFIPTNLRLGASYFLQKDINSFTFSADLNKLLVPTNPTYKLDQNGIHVYKNNEIVVDKGMDPNVSVFRGIYQSFYDAPNGFEEEVKEIYYGLGFEWWYNNMLALRTGYCHEHENKGLIRYYALGVGGKYGIFGLAFTYMINQNNHKYLKDTWYLTLLIQFSS
ncbi:MAG: type IX secretion system outer membrane channel protein PorV, partial [Bacteroidales bacterium]|nr:type IX secretion system outer membrane channel protein PorV [Bacteroidales bacterium]